MINLKIGEQYQNIGLLFSGGVDSTLLLYLLGLQYPDRNVFAVTAGHCGSNNWPIHIEYAQKVFDRVSKELGYGAINYHVVHYLDDNESHHCNQVMKTWPHIDCWLIGQNAAPPKGSTTKDAHDRPHDLYDTCPLPHRKTNLGEEWAEQHGRPIYRPLLRLNKKEIVCEYKRRSVYHLIEHTRSCPKVWPAHHANDFVKHCGECWWCLERKWSLIDD